MFKKKKKKTCKNFSWGVQGSGRAIAVGMVAPLIESRALYTAHPAHVHTVFMFSQPEP